MNCPNDPVLRILRRILQERRIDRKARQTAGALIKSIALERQVPLNALLHSRRRVDTLARHEAMRRLRTLGWSYPRIALWFRVHHTTVISACGGRAR